MDISKSSQHFAVAISPKPEGGFVSLSDNPALIVEGATEEEVRDKVIEKIGQLAGPEMATVFRDNWKQVTQSLPRTQSTGEKKKFNITVNKKISFSFKKDEGDDPKQVTLSAGPSAERAFSPLLKAAIAVAILLLLSWFVFRR